MDKFIYSTLHTIHVILQFNIHPFPHLFPKRCSSYCFGSQYHGIGHEASGHILVMTLLVKYDLFLVVTISNIWVTKYCDHAISNRHFAKSVGYRTFYLTTCCMYILLFFLLEIACTLFCLNIIEYMKNWIFILSISFFDHILCLSYCYKKRFGQMSKAKNIVV